MKKALVCLIFLVCGSAAYADPELPDGYEYVVQVLAPVIEHESHVKNIYVVRIVRQAEETELKLNSLQKILLYGYPVKVGQYIAAKNLEQTMIKIKKKETYTQTINNITYTVIEVDDPKSDHRFEIDVVRHLTHKGDFLLLNE